jgi:aldehyde:ferredoxin oxidoreductase
VALRIDLAGLAGGTAAGPAGASGDEPAPLAALRILADAVAAGHRDPFDPAVPLVLVAGPLAGSGAPGTARVAAIGLSPLSGASLALLGDLVAAGTGYRPDTAALLELGADRLRRQHRINTALGVTEPDRLPCRMHAEPVAAGAHAGAVLDPESFAAALTRLRTGLGLS